MTILARFAAWVVSRLVAVIPRHHSALSAADWLSDRLACDKAELDALANPDPGLWERARR